jgi:hypothetical protein
MQNFDGPEGLDPRLCIFMLNEPPTRKLSWTKRRSIGTIGNFPVSVNFVT